VGAGEVEDALLEHPAVAEAAVTGEPDDRLGQRIVAWVVLCPDGDTTAGALEDHVAATLAAHKRPRDVRFVSAFPRNEMGKVVKSALRGRAASPDPGPGSEIAPCGYHARTCLPSRPRRDTTTSSAWRRPISTCW
jgi:acyl-coenzyme A synthetase/AMP-(fatty) acid ligase